MKTIIILISFLFVAESFAQNNIEDIFKYPLERDYKTNVKTAPAPVNTNPNSVLFFNMNISQNSAPQNEPSVAISKKNPNRVVAAWRDFRFGIDPNANRRVGYSYSTNAGLTWSYSAILDSTLMPTLIRNSDPVVTVDTAGNFYIAVIALTNVNGNGTLAIYKSTNGGVTFPNAYIIAQSGSEDKEWMATDLTPSSPYVNSIYISWTRFSSATGIKLTKSTNCGLNWTAPVSISDATNNVQGSNICVSRNGQINVVWLGYGANANLTFDKSTDGGATFGTDAIIATGTFPAGLPNGAPTFPSIAVDNSTGSRSGWIYVVFADNRNGDCDVFFTRSTNSGANWSSPLRVNNDALANGKIQYWPAIAVNEIGNIAILFMDTRNTTDNTIFEAWAARSYDGGSTFTNELLSAEPSPTAIPGSNVRFGDYSDIDYVGQNIVPVWTDERAGGYNMDIYSSEVSEVLGIDPVVNNLPGKFELKQNYPNPFNPSTTIKFVIGEKSHAKLTVCDVLGNEIKTLLEGDYIKGEHTYNWNAGNLSSGIYFIRLEAGNFLDVKKALLVK